MPLDSLTVRKLSVIILEREGFEKARRKCKETTFTLSQS